MILHRLRKNIDGLAFNWVINCKIVFITKKSK